MSDLEYRQELSPDQLAEAVALLERAAGAKTQNSGSGGETGTAAGPPAGVRNLQQRTRHMYRSALCFCALGIGAAAGLAILAWSEPAPPPSSRPDAGPAELSKPAAPAPLAAGSAASLPVTSPTPGRTPAASERPEPPTTPARLSDRDAGWPVPATAQGQPTPAPRASHKPEARRHARATRAAVARRQLSARYRPAHRDIDNGVCSFFMCIPWQLQPVVYEPPRNSTR
jgi:hypothetical protein